MDPVVPTRQGVTARRTRGRRTWRRPEDIDIGVASSMTTMAADPSIEPARRAIEIHWQVDLAGGEHGRRQPAREDA